MKEQNKILYRYTKFLKLIVIIEDKTTEKDKVEPKVTKKITIERRT